MLCSTRSVWLLIDIVILDYDSVADSGRGHNGPDPPLSPRCHLLLTCQSVRHCAVTCSGANGDRICKADDRFDIKNIIVVV